MSTTVPTSATLPGGLVALPSVYRPQADTRLLAEALAHEELGPRTDVLEIGTGTGALALHAARRAPPSRRSTSPGPRWRRPA